jgi:hypothetical protein
MDPNIPTQPIAQQQVAQQPPIQQNPIPSSRIRWKLILLITILLIIVGSGTYLLGTKQNKLIAQDQQKAITPTIVQTSPTPTLNPTANWKTYTSNYLSNNFSIKYPANFYLDITGKATNYIGDSKSSVETYLSNGSLRNTQVVISILSLSEDFGNNLQALADRVGGDRKDNNGNSIENLPFQSVTIDGVKSIKVNKINAVSYAIPTSIGFIWISAGPADSTQIQTFEVMMTTFKLINQNQAVGVSPDSFIQNYYNSYLACLTNHFNNVMKGASSGKSPVQDCPYDAKVFTPSLYSQLQKGQVNVGGNPILCAQNTPQSIAFDRAVVSTSGTATIVVHTIWGSSSPQDINVGLQAVNNQWEITSISCNR